MSERNDFGAFLAGFIVGGAVGALAALLLAPQSGEETREYLRQRSIELKERTAQTTEEALKRAEEALAEARARAEELARVAQEQVIELQRRGAEAWEEQKRKVEETARRIPLSKKKQKGSVGASSETSGKETAGTE